MMHAHYLVGYLCDLMIQMRPIPHSQAAFGYPPLRAAANAASSPHPPPRLPTPCPFLFPLSASGVETAVLW